MRCLYCGKELALLKRLTGGAEFCSDAHRQQYQAEYNEIALSRLLQNQQTREGAPALPLAVPPPVAEPVLEAVAPEPPRRVLADPPPPLSGRNAEWAPATVLTPPAPTAPGDDPPSALAGPVPDPPSLLNLQHALWREGDPPFAPRLVTALPRRNYDSASEDREHTAWTTPQVAWKPFLVPSNIAVRPRKRNLEVRDFVRQAVAPAVTLQHSSEKDQVALASAIGDSMEITNQPHPPTSAPALWWAGPLETGSIPLVLGDLARLNFDVTAFEAAAGFETDTEPVRSRNGGAGHVPLPPVSPKEATPQPVQAAPESIAAPGQAIQHPESPKAAEIAAPVQAPAAVDPLAGSIAAPTIQPLAIVLHGSGAVAGKPHLIISQGIPVRMEPQAPRSSALPLRPSLVLGPAPVEAPAPAVAVPAQPLAPPAKAAVDPEPVSMNAGPANVEESRLLPPRPSRATNVKNRRSDVRVIPASNPSTPLPIPAAGARTTPAPPLAQSKPVPAAPLSETPSRSTSRPPQRAVPATASASAQQSVQQPAEIDLGLPTLHMELREGPWTRLPAAVKMAVAGVIVVCIVGFAYNAFNSNPAAAKPVTQTAAYQLGKQISTSGWIEDWAPADTFRRVTLLRGSQPYSDYRIEFNAQIQTKALGWMFRGLNPKNFYVVKIEKIKGGLQPEVALVRYAVIDGKSEGRVEKPLPESMKLRVDTMYKVRFDAVGNLFSVWVQGEKLDEWRDSRLGSGGVGLYAEGDEVALVQGTVNVFELVSAK